MRRDRRGDRDARRGVVRDGLKLSARLDRTYEYGPFDASRAGPLIALLSSLPNHIKHWLSRRLKC